MGYVYRFVPKTISVKARRPSYKKIAASLDSPQEMEQKIYSILKLFFSGYKTYVADAIKSMANLLPQVLPDILDSFSPSERLSDILYHECLKPLQDFYKSFAGIIQRMTSDEFTLFDYILKKKTADLSWLQDANAASEEKLNAFKQWMKDSGIDEGKTDWTQVEGIGKDFDKQLGILIKALKEGPVDVQPIPPEIVAKINKGEIVPTPEQTIAILRQSITSAGMAGAYLGPEKGLETISVQNPILRLLKIGESTITGETKVDSALKRMYTEYGLPRAARTITTAEASLEALDITLWAVPWGKPLAILGIRGIKLVPGKGRMLVSGTEAVLAKLTAQKLATIKALKELPLLAKIAMATGIAGTIYGYYGTTAHGTWAVEESCQQYGFALMKTSVYDKDGVNEITNKVRDIIKNRWKVFIPVAGTFWAYNRFFEAVLKYCDVVDGKAESAHLKGKKKTKLTVQE